MNITVLGAGSWGTALSLVLAKNGNNVTIWDIREELINEIKETRINKVCFPDLVLPEKIGFESDIKESIKDSKVVVFAVASQAVRAVSETIKDILTEDQVIVNVAKGIENSTLMRSSEIVEEIFPNNHFVVLSGPSHAEEVADGIPTTLVSASKDRVSAELIQDLFINKSLRVYTNPDVVGVELGGALKNIIALGAGISDGLGFGDNAKAALMTRGISEITRLGLKLGAKEATFQGLTGVGDLIVTCTSMHSRNRRCGIEIGKGVDVQKAIDSIGMVVEGIYAVKAAYELSVKNAVDMPITSELYRVIYEGYDVRESVKNLMLRSKKHEIEESVEW